MLSCGYLIWRGSGKIINAVLGALVVPTLSIMLFGAVVGREALELMTPWGLILGMIATIGVLAYLARN